LGDFVASQGVHPTRLVFTKRANSRADYLRRMRCADLVLDTSPFNSGSVAVEALYMGVPMVTVAGGSSGKFLSARMGASLLTSVSLSSLVTHGIKEFVLLVENLYRHRTVLRSIRSLLSRREGPLFCSSCMILSMERFFTGAKEIAAAAGETARRLHFFAQH
jgi:predicted O-linked N-acetylglucosamine transferase (SPINDLY family)